MTSRGQALLALVAVAAVVAGAVGLDRLGPRAQGAVPPGTAPSGAWYCPHGGGDSGWTVTLAVANPGSAPVDIRVTDLDVRKPDPPKSYTVQPGTTLSVPAAAAGREASTYIEYFGGWVAAGWVAHAKGAETGVAAEPCAPAAGIRWLAVDGDTDQGQNAFLVVMNPFAIDAVMSIALYTGTRAPIRNSKLTDVVVAAHRSVSINLNAFAKGEVALTADVTSSVGRIAVASLGTSDAGGIRSVIGVTSSVKDAVMPAVGDAGQSVLVVGAPGTTTARFGATLLSRGPPGPAAGLTGSTMGARSAKTYPVVTQGPSAIEVKTLPGSPGVGVARRAQGRASDTGATGGAIPAASWIVTPTVAGSPNVPGMALANPGSAEVTVTLRVLPAPDTTVTSPAIDVTIPAASVVDVPVGFLQQAPESAVLATSSAGTFVPAGASSSLGQLGIAGYAVAVGIPIPR
jgi:hypothetical protein